LSTFPLPKDFDANEWFVIISLLASYTGLFLGRKIFPRSMIILIILFSAVIARITDYELAGPPLDLYDLMDTGKYELFDMFSYLLYGPFAFAFLAVYHKLNIKGIYILFYLVVCSGLSVAYEWLTVVFDVFTFKEWKSTFSFPVYLVVQSLTLYFYHFLLMKRDRGGRW
jgi:hypothetical protein